MRSAGFEPAFLVPKGIASLGSSNLLILFLTRLDHDRFGDNLGGSFAGNFEGIFTLSSLFLKCRQSTTSSLIIANGSATRKTTHKRCGVISASVAIVIASRSSVIPIMTPIMKNSISRLIYLLFIF